MTASQKVRYENYRIGNKMFIIFKPITISSTSIQRAEQIMSQAATKEQYDDNDEIDDDELCRVNRFIFISKSY